MSKRHAVAYLRRTIVHAGQDVAVQVDHSRSDATARDLPDDMIAEVGGP